MRYAVVYSDKASGKLDQLPPLVASHVMDEIDRLAADPVGLSGPAHFPYRPVGQAFHPEPYENEGIRYYFYVAFTYQREEAIFIEFIAVSTLR